MSSKKMFILSLLITVAVGLFCFTNLVWAEDYGLSATAGAAGLDKTLSGSLPSIVGNLLGTALSFIGVLFFALMVFGGFMWMTARGNEEQTKKALNTITAAVIGLVIVLSSYTITSFVFKSVGVQEGGSVASGGGADSGETSPCAEYGTGWTCNTLDKCGAFTTTVSSTDFAKEEKVTAGCTTVGTDNCQYVKDKCPKTGENFQVCCKPKDASQEKTKWCFDKTFKGCVRVSARGEEVCVKDTDRYYFVTGKKPATPQDESHNPTDAAEKTEIECLQQEMPGQACEKDADCQNTKSGLSCIQGKCAKPSEGGGCVTNKDCLATQVCVITADSVTGGKCGTATPCTHSETIIGASEVAFGSCQADKCENASKCETDKQCGTGNFCVENKCRKGGLCSYCENDADCPTGNFCDTTSLLEVGCRPKIVKGGKCAGLPSTACGAGLSCKGSVYSTSKCE